MPYRNPLVSGTQLVRSAIQSQGYTPGVFGWSISRDGTAEFNSLTARGSLVVGDPAAAHVITTATIPADLQAFATNGTLANSLIGSGLPANFPLPIVAATLQYNVNGAYAWCALCDGTDGVNRYSYYVIGFFDGASFGVHTAFAIVRPPSGPTIVMVGTNISADKLDVQNVLNVLGSVTNADVTGTFSGSILPTNAGLASWTFDPAAGHSNSQPAVGVVHLARLIVSRVFTPTTLYIDVDVAGGGLSNSSAGLYDSGGNLLKTVTGLSPTFQSGGVKAISLAGIAALGRGTYYAAVLIGGATSAPAFTTGSGKGGLPNAGISAAPFRYMTSGAGLTALPNTVNLAAAAAVDKAFWWGLA